MEPIDDIRRWAIVRGAGCARLMMDVDGYLVDLEGSVEERDRELSSAFARRLVLHALSVVSLRNGGRIEMVGAQLISALTNFDWFENVDPEIVERALALAARPVNEENGADWEPTLWLDEVRGFVRDVESVLDLDGSLPSLYSSEGMFPGLAATREWMKLCEAVGVNPAVIWPHR